MLFIFRLLCHYVSVVSSLCVFIVWMFLFCFFFFFFKPKTAYELRISDWSSDVCSSDLSRWNHALALAWVAHENLCMNNILANASEAQKQKYLPGLNSGKLIGALGLTEPGAGSDAIGSMRTTARREGDFYYLNGRKIFITNGPVADVLLVYAKTDKDQGNQGVSAGRKGTR